MMYDAIIFNANNVTNPRLGPLTSAELRAFFRHAVGKHYEAATNVGKYGTLYKWQNIIHRLVGAFRDAAVRWATGIKLQYANRVHSNLTEQVAECVREKFPRLITFNANCSDFAVAAPLAAEMTRAEANRV